MAKKRKPSKTKKIQRASEQPEPIRNDKTEPAIEDDKPFDFGGLPQRDLKKNLGCG